MQASDLAVWLKASRWTYPAVNAGHLLGIALLVGAVVPMDLRLIGIWRGEVPIGRRWRCCGRSPPSGRGWRS